MKKTAHQCTRYLVLLILLAGSLAVTISVKGPTTISSCDTTFSLLARTSNSSTNSPFAYFWSVVNETSPYSISRSWSGQSSPYITINNATGFLTIGKTYTFSITASNSYERATVTFSTMRVASIFPHIIIDNTSPTLIASQSFTAIQANATICTSETMYYRWNQTGGPKIIAPLTLTNRKLILYAQNFPNQSLYEFTVTAYTASGKNSSSSTTISFVYDSVTAIINGGSRGVPRFANSITIDGGSSLNPANVGVSTFSWTCLSCTSDIATFLSSVTTSKFTIPFDVPIQTFTLTLTYSNGFSASVASVSISTIDSTQVLPVWITRALPTYPNVNDVRFLGRSTSKGSPLSYQWTISNSSSVLYTSVKATITDMELYAAFQNGTGFIFASGTAYTARLDVIDARGLTGYAEINFKVLLAPVAGKVYYTPGAGYAITTTFRFTCADWISADGPLLYYFTYSDYQGNELPLTIPSSLNSIPIQLPQGVFSTGSQLQVNAYAISTKGSIASTTFKIISGPTYDLSNPQNAADYTRSIITTLLASNTNDSNYPTQIMLGALNVLNPGLPTDTVCTDSKSCNYAGTCLLGGSCSCLYGWIGSDCSFTSYMVLQRQSVRTQAIKNYLNYDTTVNTSARFVPATKYAIQQQLGALYSLTSVWTEISYAVYLSWSAQLVKLLSYNFILDDSSVQIALQSTSNVIDTMFLSTVSVADIPTLALIRASILPKIAQSIASKYLPGSPPISIDKRAFSMVVQRIPASSNLYFLTTGNIGVTSTVASNGNDIDVTVVEYNYNVYDTGQSPDTIPLSHPVSIAVSAPVTSLLVAFPGTFLDTAPNTRVVCYNWNQTDWAYDACSVLSINSTAVTCKCTGVGDVAVFLAPVPDTPMPLTEPQVIGISVGAVAGFIIITLAVLLSIIVFIIVCVRLRKGKSLAINTRFKKRHYDEQINSPSVASPLPHRLQTEKFIANNTFSPDTPSIMTPSNNENMKLVLGVTPDSPFYLYTPTDGITPKVSFTEESTAVVGSLLSPTDEGLSVSLPESVELKDMNVEEISNKTEDNPSPSE